MGSKLFRIRCESLGWLDSRALTACDRFASLQMIRTACDGSHPVSGTIDKDFECLLILSHPRLFGLLTTGREAKREPPQRETLASGPTPNDR